MYSIPDCEYYLGITESFIDAGPFCILTLAQELSQLSFQTLYRHSEMIGVPQNFWWLSSSIIEMVHTQVSRDF